MADKELEIIKSAFDKIGNMEDKRYFLGVLDGLTANIGFHKDDKEKENVILAGQ